MAGGDSMTAWWVRLGRWLEEAIGYPSSHVHREVEMWMMEDGREWEMGQVVPVLLVWCQRCGAVW